MPLNALLGRIPNAKARSWAERILKFLLGQGAVQALNLFTGLLLVRWLSVPDYAQFGVVFGFQTTLSMFVDLGFSGCIVALVGNRAGDRAVLSRYIAAARALRLTSMLLVVPPAAIAFVWVGLRQGWAWEVQALLFLAVVLSLYFEGLMAWNGAALLIHQRLGTYYRGPTEAAAGRLAACGILRLAGLLTVVPLCFINVLVAVWNGFRYRAAAAMHLDLGMQADAETRREILHYLAPLIPGLIFTAFQGQILILLSSIFSGTQQIAEISALGRLSQLFIVLGAVNSTLIAPYFARLPSTQVLRRYLMVVSAAGLVCLALAGLAFAFPGPLVWLLGSHYEHLRPEIGWNMLVAVTAYFGTVMWSVNSARRWIFWWSSLVYIVSVTLGQAAYLWTYGAASTRAVLFLGIFTNLLIIGVHAAAAWRGLVVERRQPVPAP